MHLILQRDLLALHSANDDVCRVFGNNLVVVEHLEFCVMVSNIPSSRLRR